MANINGSDFYKSIELAFRTQGAGLTQFEDSYRWAVNRALRRINRDADLSSPIARIDDKDSDITLDEKYEDVLADGTTLYLMSMGQRPTKDLTEIHRDIQLRFADGIDMIRQDIINKAQDADTDDESDFVFLGGKGD